MPTLVEGWPRLITNYIRYQEYTSGTLREPLMGDSILSEVGLPRSGKDELRSVLRTFRLSESLADSLKKEAASEGTSVNTAANLIMGQYFEWEKKAREFGFMAVHKPVFMRLIEELDDETLARIGREVIPASYEEMAEFWFQESTPEKILDVMSLRFKFDTMMRMGITKEGNEYTIVLQHDLGPKWSIVAESAARELTKRFFHVEPRITRGNSVVTGRFKAKARNLSTR